MTSIKCQHSNLSTQMQGLECLSMQCLYNADSNFKATFQFIKHKIKQLAYINILQRCAEK